MSQIVEALPTYTAAHITGLPPSSRRGIFLLSSTDSWVDAAQVFAALDAVTGKARRDLRGRLDHWIAGGPPNDYWFHGFPNSKVHYDCFVFKWREQSVDQRLYGFLANPRGPAEPRYRACVLCKHDEKMGKNTDLTILDEIVKLAAKPAVIAATKHAAGKVK